MKLSRFLALAACLVGAASALAAITPGQMLANITWFGQANVRIVAGGKVIYVDPGFILKPDKADIVLFTHSHGDHYNTQSLEKLGSPELVLGGFDIPGGQRMAPGESRKVGGITITAVAAYNVVRSYHPKSSQFVGFVVEVEGVSIYFAGDTERIPEMKAIKCDIAFMPLGQRYTMKSVDEAVQATMDVGASIAIPYHWGSGEGRRADADAYAKALEAEGVKVAILDPQ